MKQIILEIQPKLHLHQRLNYDIQWTDFHEIHKYSNGISLRFPMLIFNQIGQEVWLLAC